MGADLGAIDHVVIAGPSVAELAASFEAHTGLAPAPGGAHLGGGTRNELVGIDDSTYIELIGPDPEQSPPGRPRSFGIDDLTAPAFVRFAMAVDDADAAKDAVDAAGIDAGPVMAMQRERPDGVLLRWRLVVPPDPVGGGVVPFFIEWGDTEHPAASLDHGAGFSDLMITHPTPGAVAEAIERATGASFEVTEGPGALRGLVEGPAGRWVF